MRSLAVLALVTGCGDNLDLDRCITEGFAEGEVVLDANPIGPFARAAVVETSSLRLAVTHALVFDEMPGACGEAGDGHHLVLAFCDAPAEGEYAIVPDSHHTCPGSAVVAVIERANGEDIIKANTGTVVITSTAGGLCVAGSYTMKFGGTEVLEGGFDAAVCD